LALFFQSASFCGASPETASRELELTVPAPPIERMSRVDRQAIEPDVNAVAAALDLRLGALVARIA
jgi:hypothetical protein